MRLVILIAAILALAACDFGPPPPDRPYDARISPPSTDLTPRDRRPHEPRIVPPRQDQPPRQRPRAPRDDIAGGPDACGAARHQHLVGQRLPDPFRAQGHVRIFRTGEAVTMDHSPSRLNVELHPRSGRVVRIFCG